MGIAFIVARCSFGGDPVHPDDFNPYRRRHVSRGIPLLVNPQTEAILDAISVVEVPRQT
jgi:hypothetical protein